MAPVIGTGRRRRTLSVCADVSKHTQQVLRSKCSIRQSKLTKQSETFPKGYSTSAVYIALSVKTTKCAAQTRTHNTRKGFKTHVYFVLFFTEALRLLQNAAVFFFVFYERHFLPRTLHFMLEAPSAPYIRRYASFPFSMRRLSRNTANIQATVNNR